MEMENQEKEKMIYKIEISLGVGYYGEDISIHNVCHKEKFRNTFIKRSYLRFIGFICLDATKNILNSCPIKQI